MVQWTRHAPPKGGIRVRFPMRLSRFSADTCQCVPEVNNRLAPGKQCLFLSRPAAGVRALNRWSIREWKADRLLPCYGLTALWVRVPCAPLNRNHLKQGPTFRRVVDKLWFRSLGRIPNYWLWNWLLTRIHVGSIPAASTMSILCKVGIHKWRDHTGQHPHYKLKLGYSCQAWCEKCDKFTHFVVR